jgi:hypothetical protein
MAVLNSEPNIAELGFGTGLAYLKNNLINLFISICQSELIILSIIIRTANKKH